MKSLLILLILSAFVLPVTAQEYSPYLIQHDGAYYRIAALPVKVCGEHPFLSAVISEMNRAIETVWAADTCDVIVTAVNVQACPDNAEGCAMWHTVSFYPVQVYVQTYSDVPTLLHELTHAFGVWGHPQGEPSVLNSRQWQLTAFDVSILQFLYSQPAYAIPDAMVVDPQPAYDYWTAQCLWIEAHKEQVDAKYRCE